MICAIMQPTYIPWIGYFDLIDKVDTFVFYDDVQLSKRSWQVRNRIKGINGEIWLTTPVRKYTDRENTFINQAQINSSEKWLKKHFKNIEFNYKKSQHFKEVITFLETLYIETNTIGEFNTNIIINIANKIGISGNFIKSSEIIGINGKKDDRLVQICKKIGATSYLSPQGSANYINEINYGGEFVKNNIELYYHNYIHPEYNQLYGEFIPYMGIFDLLFNEGFNHSLEIIRKGRQNNIYYSDL